MSRDKLERLRRYLPGGGNFELKIITKILN